MSIRPYSECVKCYFGKNTKHESEYFSTGVEVYYAETISLESSVSHIMKYVTGYRY